MAYGNQLLLVGSFVIIYFASMLLSCNSHSVYYRAYNKGEIKFYCGQRFDPESRTLNRAETRAANFDIVCACYTARGMK